MTHVSFHSPLFLVRQIWSVNANTGAATLTTSFIGHANSVNCLAVRVDGSVMSGDQSGVLNIWNTASPSGPALTTSITAASPRSPGVNALVDLPAAGIWPERVAAAYSDFHIRIWDAHNLTLYVTMSGHTDVVYTLCLLADRSLVSGSADGTMKVWDSSHGLLWNSVTVSSGDACACVYLEQHQPHERL